MNILLVSSTARGHAIAEALSRSRHKPSIISVCPVRNPGLKALSTQQHVMSVMDFRKIVEIATAAECALAVIGPDEPIAGGIVDALEDAGIKSVAPKKALARIESSKAFARELLQKHRVNASPAFKVFSRKQIDKEPKGERKELSTFIDQELGGNYVVKFDALKGGKGVKVSGEHLQSTDEGVAYAQECLGECGRVVIEEKLIGVEFSLMSFVSGKTVIDMPPVQDHKRAYEGDTGPNTGGMGSYTDAKHTLPFLSDKDLKRASEINRLTAQALLKETGEPYRGILYGGFIAVKDGVRLIEFNARFGDPEALNVLPLLKTDFVDLCLGIISGELAPPMVAFENMATVCKYVVPKSYPEKKDEQGKAVRFPSLVADARLYYGDINEQEDGLLHLGGSRSAGIVGIGNTIAEAEQMAQELCENVEGPVRFRHDIGTEELIQKRMETMKELRGV